ncbi:MAG: tetratricopeptide repeat protein [Bacteroidales bacterium]|nr:tetratricopeptide repeat protein [Bacteroidales bacterium]
MTKKELFEKHKQILDNIKKYQVKDAFDILFELVEKCKNQDYKSHLNNYYETYKNILKYSFELGNDPEKEKVYVHLVKSVSELADDIKEDIILNEGLLSYYQYKKTLSNDLQLKYDEANDFLTRLEFVDDLPKSGKNSEENNFSGINYDKINLLFRIIWLQDKFNETDIRLTRQIIENKFLLWHYKSVLVSALILSTLRHFDSNKVILLFEFYHKQEHEVWQRALTGILLVLFVNDKRLNYYPEITQRLKAMQGDKNITRTTEAIIIQLIKAKETEKITKKIKEEILPEVWKIKSTLDEKLNLQDILSAKNIEDKNPEWETVFKDSPDLYNKIEQFSNMQLEGSDVFLSAFALLKHFPFFNEINNWFLPFYKENQMLTSAFKDITEDFNSEVFLEGLESTAFLCNSDKYSFCMNVKHMPSMQKSMMVELFNMELKAMNEMEKENEIINNTAKDKTIITQYIQDLYRFFKLHPLRTEFDDIFNYTFDFHHTDFYHLLIDDKKVLRNIGEFYFEKDYFVEALDIFINISEKDKNYELFEKTAYCYQQLGEFTKALEYYHKAEILDQQKTWLLNKIAFCYRKSGNYKKAIEYYKKAESFDPDNLFIQNNLGNVFLETEDFESALKYYFKIEYRDPDNFKIHRPIAWCSFVLGKLENAKKYQEKVIKNEGNKHDLMNMGHILWCLGNQKEAITHYLNSLKKSKADFNWFVSVFKEDSKFLKKCGIQNIDIPLMIDYLKISFND